MPTEFGRVEAFVAEVPRVSHWSRQLGSPGAELVQERSHNREPERSRGREPRTQLLIHIPATTERCWKGRGAIRPPATSAIRSVLCFNKPTWKKIKNTFKNQPSVLHVANKPRRRAALQPPRLPKPGSAIEKAFPHLPGGQTSTLIACCG